EATIVDSLEALLAREPSKLRMLGGIETDNGVLNFRRVHADSLHLSKPPVVDEIRVLCRPESFRPKAVAIQNSGDRFCDRLPVVHQIAWNLPEPASVKVARSFLDGRVQQQELNVCAAPAEDPDIENIRRETHETSPSAAGDC